VTRPDGTPQSGEYAAHALMISQDFFAEDDLWSIECTCGWESALRYEHGRAIDVAVRQGCPKGASSRPLDGYDGPASPRLTPSKDAS
jgi:hypothetical protein